MRTAAMPGFVLNVIMDKRCGVQSLTRCTPKDGPRLIKAEAAGCFISQKRAHPSALVLKGGSDTLTGIALIDRAGLQTSMDGL
jgi:hypothetical protein